MFTTDELDPQFHNDIRTLGLPTMAYNALVRGLMRGSIKAYSIEGLAALTKEDLMQAYNLGEISAKRIIKAVKKFQKNAKRD